MDLINHEKEDFLRLIKLKENKKIVKEFKEFIANNHNMKLQKIYKIDPKVDPIKFFVHFHFDNPHLVENRFFIRLNKHREGWDLKLEGITEKDFYKIFLNLHADVLVPYICAVFGRDYGLMNVGDTLIVDYIIRGEAPENLELRPKKFLSTLRYNTLMNKLGARGITEIKGKI